MKNFSSTFLNLESDPLPYWPKFLLQLFSPETGLVNFTKFPIGQDFVFECKTFHSQAGAWLLKTLNSLQEDLQETPEELEQLLPRPSLYAKVELKKEHSSEYKGHLLFKIELTGDVYLPCIKCLIPIHFGLDFSFFGIFVIEDIWKRYSLEDQTEVYYKGAFRELYSEAQGPCNLSAILEEQCRLQLPQYPLHTSDCKGLCFTCGANLNEENCSHQK